MELLGVAASMTQNVPYLGIIFVPLIILYYIAAIYYRRSSVEMKRLDSLLRSILYGSYSGEFSALWHCTARLNAVTETLTGLSTVRAYRSQVSAFWFHGESPMLRKSM